VEVGGSVNLKTLAGLLDVCHEDLLQLNPELKRQVVPDHVKSYKIRIPSDKAEFLTANYEAFIDSASSSGKKEIEYLARNTAGSTYGRDKIIYKVKSGDVLGSIASRYNVKVTDLRTWNRINGNLIRVGQNLTIYVKSQYNASNSSIAQAPDKPAPVPESRIHLVQPGDTLWKISRQYEGLSIEKLKELNNLKTNDIKPGQKLVVG
jgi:membrane-bound lytic murein transglycosylase D